MKNLCVVLFLFASSVQAGTVQQAYGAKRSSAAKPSVPASKPSTVFLGSSPVAATPPAMLDDDRVKCEGGSEQACYRLAQVYAQPGHRELDTMKAQDVLATHCTEYRNPQACAEAAKSFRQNGKDDRAESMLKIACENGVAAACGLRGGR